MTNKVVCTLSSNKVGAKLALSQGNLVVTTTDVADIHRAVFGTLAMGSGQVSFECAFWSNAQAVGGLSGLASVGVAQADCSIAKYVGEEANSFGYFPADAVVKNNNAVISTLASPPLQAQPERQYIGVFLDFTVSPPIISWQINGAYLFQTNLTTGRFYVPAVSIGSTTPGDISAYVNFGQSRFQYPIFQVNK
jgi:hypothetical protein